MHVGMNNFKWACYPGPRIHSSSLNQRIEFSLFWDRKGYGKTQDQGSGCIGFEVSIPWIWVVYGRHGQWPQTWGLKTTKMHFLTESKISFTGLWSKCQKEHVPSRGFQLQVAAGIPWPVTVLLHSLPLRLLCLLLLCASFLSSDMWLHLGPT